MISLNRLLFPQFIYQEDVPLKDSKVPLYKLDWDKIDKIRRDRYLNDASTPEKSFPGTLPEPYNSEIKKMSFAISNQYMEEIRRCARLGLFEWCTNRSFDTMIREICMEPAIHYIFVSFRLIADCLYDEDTKYFSRHPDKIYVPQALLYKFWSFQTGKGLVKDNALFKKLDFYTYKPIGFLSEPTRKKFDVVKKFTETVRKHEKKYCRSISLSKESISEEEKIAEFLGNKRFILRMPDFSYDIIIRSEYLGGPEESLTVEFKNVFIRHVTHELPNFVSKYEMRVTTVVEDPDIFKRVELCHFTLDKYGVLFKIKNVHVRGFHLLEITEEDALDELFEFKKVEVRMEFDSIETQPSDEEYKSTVVKKINLERADEIVLEELGNKVIKKNGRLRPRSVMDDVLEIQESTPVKEIPKSKFVAVTFPDDEDPVDLDDRFEFDMLQGPPPTFLTHQDPFEFDFDIDPNDVKPLPTKASTDGQALPPGA